MIVVRLTQLFDSVKQTLFILGTALIGFLALRNSVVWHMQQFWGASGDFWQRQWAAMYNQVGNELLLTTVGSFVFTVSVFWLANAVLLVLDLTGWPAFLLKYKIQADKNNPVKKSDLLRAVKVAIFNQTVVGIPFLVAVYYAMRWRGCSCSPDDLPTFQWAVFELAIFTLVEEIGFYYSHRLFHHPKLYKHIHKVHHEWTASIGVVSIYAHPVEHVLSNILPPALGPLLMGSHLATTWMFWAIALLSTTVSHCGYHFPFLPSPEAHDFHHQKFNQNYGALGILDRLHGTDAQFRNSLAYQRHFLLLSMVPVSQQIPDPPKKNKAE
ncbi:fatty acid hydroxylase domain-containing protein 2 [Aplysia californica]|uniref:Fatty acid hydroxylase domain-containing protein 2 n=1 Tax=Aplysia californica TaxID=6500 RepID=A0ABM0JZ83_APLCA|nr:fatty acid hydroxylase domain-containing protein 2 [Aplysia californica]XP_005105016.1 fatty acid hydroxylase domain-containing protein 2 [Aplysia californica]